MSQQLYCDPCQRLLLGTFSVNHEYKNEREIEFDHHLDYASFERAMQLPCSICIKAWQNSEYSPHGRDWKKICGVYTHVAEYKRRTLSFYADDHENEDHESSNLFLEHRLGIAESPENYTLSSNTADALDFLRLQYHNCCTLHGECSNLKSAQENIYPRRLLDVGSEGSLVMLRSTSKFKDQEYACLSHCWGGSKPYTLNSSTQHALASGIHSETLPKTFKDAIHVTRCLSIPYLWIDSLCIIQDSVEDWAAESARMGDIYARAALTIAATSSPNSEGGLSFERHIEPILPRLLDFQWAIDAPWLEGKVPDFYLKGTYLCDVEEMATRHIEDAPLNRRAWVSQERQLSHRIIHFTGSQLFWECDGNKTCETYPRGLPDKALPYWSEDPTMLKRSLHTYEQQRPPCSDDSTSPSKPMTGWNSELCKSWGLFRWRYSSNALTQASDKLIALHGIAERVSRFTDDELIAGLWKNRLPGELCWYRECFSESDLHAAHRGWRAPSWSWAAYDGSILMSTESMGLREKEAPLAEMVVTEIDVCTKPSGEIAHGSLTIKCKPILAVVQAVVKTSDWDFYNTHRVVLIENDVDLSDGGVDKEVSRFDIGLRYDDLNTGEPRRAFLVVVQRYSHPEIVEDKTLDIAQKSNASTSKSERMGTPPDPDRDSALSVPGVDVTEDEGKVDSHLAENCSRDWLEGLLLQVDVNDVTALSRIGKFDLRGSEDIRPLLEAHRKAEERIIKLV